MQKEYDFSKGERGKFYNPDAEFHVPVYLDDEVLEMIKRIARKKNLEVDVIVNQVLKKEMELLKLVE